MRVIEVCINEPFGKVENVSLGYGSTEALMCFFKAFKDDKGHIRKDDFLRGAGLKWLRECLVKKVEDSFNSKCPFIDDELNVMRLSWSENKLLHVETGKEVDDSDIEHLLCSLYVLLQHTLPNRNIGKASKLDGEKYHPIKSKNNGETAISLDIMKTIRETNKEIRTAYKRLMRNPSYKGRKVHNIFKIDLE